MMWKVENYFDADQYDPDQNAVRGVVSILMENNPNQILRCGQVKMLPIWIMMLFFFTITLFHNCTF